MFGWLVVGLLLVACGGSGPKIAGSVSLVRSPRAELGEALGETPVFVTAGGACSGAGGYSDLQMGAQVVIKDDRGAVVGTTTVARAMPTLGSCIFEWDAVGVPKRDFYSVEVGHRSGVTKSAGELKANGWRFSLEIGN